MPKTFRHTVNIAAGLNIVVFDDRGQVVDEFIFPFALFFFSLSGWLYGATLQALRCTVYFISALLDLAGWRTDLHRAAWAVRLLVHQRKFAYAY